MNNLTTFSAVHASGLLIPNRRTVTALALLYDKVYLPAQIEAITAFCKSYKLEHNLKDIGSLSIKDDDGRKANPFSKLTTKQQQTAVAYLNVCQRFAISYGELFGPVFQTNAYEEGRPLKATLVKKGKPGELNTYRVRMADMRLTEGDEKLYPTLLNQGYVPIVTCGDVAPNLSGKLNAVTTKQLAALLAMKSVEMLLPRTKGAPGEVILEARDRLRNHLPMFWSAMFKLSAELREVYQNSRNVAQAQIEAENFVDATVRPALLDLRHKLELERKQWFYKILSPIQKGVRLMIGAPGLTQQQLITNALVLACDATSAGADHIKKIEALKNEAGLTYLLELDKVIGEDQS